MMLELILNPPWYVPAVLFLVAIVLLYQGNNRRARGMIAAGLAAALAAIVILLVGYLFETDQKRVIDETKQLVKAVDGRDWTKFKSLLDPQVRFAIYAGRDQLTAGAQKTVDAVGAKNISSGSFETQAVPGGYDVTFTATADFDIGATRAPTNWKFSWAKDPGDKQFLLYRIEPLPTAQFGTEPILTHLVPAH